MTMLNGPAMVVGGDLNPLIPSPVAVIAFLVLGALVFVALVAAGVFLGIRLASRSTADAAQSQTSGVPTNH